MYREIKLEEFIGKTITNYAFSWGGEQFVIIFSDNTFITINSIPGYDDGETSIHIGKIDVLEFGDDVLVECGIIDKEEMKVIRDKDTEEKIARQNASEKQQYERLHKKYGNLL